MAAWSNDADAFLRQFKESHPGFYERLLASPPFRGDRTSLIGTAEIEIERLGPDGAYAGFLTFVATMYAKDLARSPKVEEENSSPSTVVAKLRSLASEMRKMTWEFVDLKALDHARHVLETQVEELNAKAGFVAPKGPKRAPIDLVEARRLLANGVPLGKVARKFGVSPGAISKLTGQKGSE